MKIQQQVHYCEECDKQVPFNRAIHHQTKDIKLILLNKEILVKDQQIPVCPYCEQEISDDVLDSQLLMNAIDTWEKETGKVYTDQFPRKN